jgi:hypothetical protein
MAAEELNDKVREHEISTSWEHRELAQMLHRWFDLFNSRFFEFKLPQCFLRFERTRRTRLAHYQPGRNSIGAAYEINLNPVHLERPLYQILCTLLHEMVHEWQCLFGKPGSGGYHNK